jgi:hypothetical protein
MMVVENFQIWKSSDNSLNLSGAPEERKTPAPILNYTLPCAEAVDINGRFQMQGGKNWILPK